MSIQYSIYLKYIFLIIKPKITEILDIDISILFLPVDSSLQNNSEATSKNKNEIIKNIKNSVDAVLEELYQIDVRY